MQYPSVKRSSRGRARVEYWPTWRTGHLAAPSRLREALELLDSWRDSSSRMFTSSAGRQGKPIH